LEMFVWEFAFYPGLALDQSNALCWAALDKKLYNCILWDAEPLVMV